MKGSGKMNDESKPKVPELTDEDYYTDELGRIVFTEAYHLKRGYCCGSGCRHCPYGNGKKENLFQNDRTLILESKHSI